MHKDRLYNEIVWSDVKNRLNYYKEMIEALKENSLFEENAQNTRYIDHTEERKEVKAAMNNEQVTQLHNFMEGLNKGILELRSEVQIINDKVDESIKLNKSFLEKMLTTKTFIEEQNNEQNEVEKLKIEINELKSLMKEITHQQETASIVMKQNQGNITNQKTIAAQQPSSFSSLRNMLHSAQSIHEGTNFNSNMPQGTNLLTQKRRNGQHNPLGSSNLLRNKPMNHNHKKTTSAHNMLKKNLSGSSNVESQNKRSNQTSLSVTKGSPESKPLEDNPKVNDYNYQTINSINPQNQPLPSKQEEPELKNSFFSFFKKF
ncbi:hypothetical protein ACQCVK_12055 [Rossellomorea vietnamensis]|uniref:hypothetical protein n=1 Tax=Rossellomorea vietnamensis TaxID=218284 RepID=UPI003CF05FDC